MPTRSEPQHGRVGPRGAATTRWAVLLGLLCLVGVIGCSPPQVDPEHRDVVLRLATATSARDAHLLEAVADDIARLRDAGTLRGAPADAIEAIVSAGRAGSWEQAQRLAYALRDAQEPTRAEVDRLRTRPLPPPKIPGHE
ncbi:hypothetical protein AB1L88_07030 [Tautonia sp. JC769]|uniref:hypothetical protein n=1 Tax=Tautonia sp. JC769 TaxID=3232135 RepID=UPI00345A2CCF